MKNWTESQKLAIESKGSTLVTASAGTGKTAVLTEKVASLFLQDNITVNQILVMTFSNAAAEEMKTRIANKLATIAKDKTLSYSKRRVIFSQLRLLHTANIKTIHAFCNDIVKKYYYEVNLSSNIKVGDILEIAILKRKAIKNVLDNEYKKEEREFIELLEYFDASEEIEDIFIKSYEKVYNNIKPEDWLDKSIELYNVSNNEIPDFMLEKILKDFNEAKKYLENCILDIECEDDEKLNKNKSIISTDINIINNIILQLKNKNINAINQADLSDFGKTIRFSSEYSDIRDTRNKGKDLIVDNYKKNNFNIEKQLERIKHMHPMVKKFSEIIVNFDNEYSKLKNELNIIDFHDMEKYANKILDNKNISLLYKNTFKYVFVDEYQDTSPIQEAIIKKISGTNNLFCVGDQKQSIYGFRASEPELFINRNNAYKDKVVPGQVISLNNNFRSSKNILDCANDVFFNISKTSKEINYDKNVALIHGRNDKGDFNPVIVDIIPEELKQEFEDLSSDEIEVYNLVDKIKQKIGQTIYDSETNEYREIKYSDIVILCRKLTNISSTFTKIFTANKIPFIIEKSGGLLSTVEVENLLNIFKLCNNIDNDLAIVSFIHEGFLSFNDDDLIEIRKKDFNNSIIENMKNISQESNSLSKKCEEFLNFFKSIHLKESYLNLNELVNYIITELNYIDYYAIQMDGKQKIANIKLFQQYIYDYDRKNNDKIWGFVKYIEELKKTGIIIDEAKVNYNENSIKITTIHKSKGLEYPIVFLPFMGKNFSTIDKRINVNVEKNIGLGFKYFNLGKNEKGKTFIRTLIDDVMSEKAKEEEMRLLYVAMTRAKEELFIQGFKSNVKEITSLSDASTMFDWIISTVISKFDNKTIEDLTDAPINLTGKWLLTTVISENVSKYLDVILEPVSDENFLDRFSLPSTPKNKEEKIELIDKNIPITISASQIWKDKTESIFKTPNFLQDKNAMLIGTATHNFLKYVDFQDDLSYFGLLEQKEDILNKNLMKKEELDLIDYIKLEKFFQTDLASEIISADEIKRERSLSVLDYADNVGYFSHNSKQILIRCILDLMYKKDGEWYLVDYKTDKIKDEKDDDELTNKIISHRSQLAFYERAIKQIYGITIKDTYIVFLDIGKAFKLFKYE